MIDGSVFPLQQAGAEPHRAGSTGRQGSALFATATEFDHRRCTTYVVVASAADEALRLRQRSPFSPPPRYGCPVTVSTTELCAEVPIA